MNTDSKKSFYISLAVAVLSVVVMVFMGKYFLKITQSSYDKLNLLYASIDNYYKQEQYLKDIENEIILMTDRKQAIENNFVANNEEVSFIIALEKIAEETSNVIDITVKSVSQEDKNENDDILIFDIDLAGTFPNLLRFIDKMEKSSYFIDISSLNTQKVEKGFSPKEGEILAQDQIEGNVKTSLLVNVYTK